VKVPEHVKLDLSTGEIDGLGPLGCPKCGDELHARLAGSIALEDKGDGSYLCSDATSKDEGETTLYCKGCEWEASK
jgi:hypothetical protein